MDDAGDSHARLTPSDRSYRPAQDSSDGFSGEQAIAPDRCADGKSAEAGRQGCLSARPQEGFGRRYQGSGEGSAAVGWEGAEEYAAEGEYVDSEALG